ncbi:MAG: hypothetical protein R3B48_28505 [Kofleriaceae bacterium]
MSSSKLLDDAVDALRVEHAASGDADVDAALWRIHASLDGARAARGRWVAALVVILVLSTGGVSWAYLSGTLARVWSWTVGAEWSGARSSAPVTPARARHATPAVAAAPTAAAPIQRAPAAPPAEPVIERAPPTAAIESAPPTIDRAAPPAPAAAPAIERAAAPGAPESARIAVADSRVRTSAPSAASAPPSEPVRPPRVTTTSSSPPRAAPAAEPSRADARDLYRRAHELHFHQAAPAAALAAWDEYLRGEPGGRFAVEARYNRAIALVKLARYAEAALALEPFARGEVEPRGYRQAQAQLLLDKIARVTGGAAR